MVSIDNGTAPATVNGHTAKGSAFAPATTAKGTLSENDAFRKRKTAILPLEVGSRVNCRWRDGKHHPVKVIERRKLFYDGANDYEYYVHYTECETFFFSNSFYVSFDVVEIRVWCRGELSVLMLNGVNMRRTQRNELKVLQSINNSVVVQVFIQ